MNIRLSACLMLLLSLSSCATWRPTTSSDAPLALKIASWNLEFLAEKDGAGCEPRTSNDYREMRRIVDNLDADVIAFQEAESVAAAERVFDPARYTVVMETRAGKVSGTCGDRHSGQPFIRQAVGFAVKKNIPFERNADVTSLMLDNPQLRSGIDITIKPRRHAKIRLLGIHLKSGCFAGNEAKACPTLLQQVPALEAWIDAAARSPTRFAVLGDWNRRLSSSGDQVWNDLDDGEPANADLRLADAGTLPGCDPRFDSFIDHIVLDHRAGRQMMAFHESRYEQGEKHYSDHCPVAVTLRD